MAAPSAPRPVLLAIADISGYTRFMIANKATLAHAQAIIGELIESIVAEVQIPLKVSKLEGDAVFLYSMIDEDRDKWLAVRDEVRDRLRGFFQAFARKIDEIASSTGCTCGACQNVSGLKLKLVVHAGEAVVHTVVGFEELAGVDVIVVHRLLKNSVEGNEYALFTAAAWDLLGSTAGLLVEPSVEKYDDVGDIPVRVWKPSATMMAAREREKAPVPSGVGHAVPWTGRFLGRIIRVVVKPPALKNVEVPPDLPGGWVPWMFVVLAPWVYLYMTAVNVAKQMRQRPA